MKRWALGMLLIVGSGFAQEFVVKQKKKRVTSSQLKEQIGSLYEEISKLSSRAICSLSNLNPLLIDRTKDLINGDIATDISMLEKHLTDLQNMQSQLQVLDHQINAMFPLVDHKVATKSS